MAWVTLDDNFTNHPKVVTAGPIAGFLFVAGVCYCRRFHTNGFIPDAAVKTLGVTLQLRKSVETLIAVGLWDRTDDGYNVHDYQQMYENDAAEKEAKIRARQRLREAGRKGGLESKRLNGFEKPCSSVEGVGGVTSSLSSSLRREGELETPFDLFWGIYPRSDGKRAAFDKWTRLNPDAETQARIMADVERRKRSRDWTKDGGQFIPHASTYLHGRRWEDGFKESVTPQTGAAAASVLETLLGNGTHG